MRPRLSTAVLSAPSRAAPGRRRAEFQSVLRWLTIFALTATAVAQPGTKDLSNASLEELSNIQVYSASKHMQSARDAPSSVTVVTADEIQKYGYLSLADVLQSVRGFYPPASTTFSTRNTSIPADGRMFKMQFNRTEEVSGSKLLPGFERA